MRRPSPVDPVRGGGRPRRRPDRVRARVERVSVPFEPRPEDDWAVGGASPQALPAGRLTGQAIRERAGRVRADRRPCVIRPDGPIVDPRGGDPGRPRRGRRSGRSRARGVRLPAVLGAVGQLDHARLGKALDDRLLRGGCRRQRQPRDDQQGRIHDRRLGRLDQLEDDPGHRAGARQQRPGRPHRPELRLELERREQAEGAARELDRACQPGSPDRRRGPRSGRRRGQPRRRADRLRRTPTSSRRWSGRSAPSSMRSRRATSSPSIPWATSATIRSRRPPLRAAPMRS